MCNNFGTKVIIIDSIVQENCIKIRLSIKKHIKTPPQYDENF